MQLDDPLLPDYNFNAHFVAGITPIEKDKDLDFIIDRKDGMKGLILNLTTKGKGLIFQGEQAFTVEKGDVLLFPAHVPHYYQRLPSENSWYHRWIYFRPRGFWGELLNWQQEKNGVFITHLSRDEHYSALETLFIEVERNINSDAPFSNDMAANLVEQLLIRIKMLQPENVGKIIDPRVQQAVNLMMDNINHEFSIEELAQKVCISASRLSHLFRRDMNATLTRWRDDQRISYAKQLLLTTHLSINKISRMVGFTDPLYFSRVFKKISGVSPKTFRDKTHLV